MTEIQNPKQKNNCFEPVWNFLFEIWCLNFEILDTKLQGIAIYL